MKRSYSKCFLSHGFFVSLFSFSRVIAIISPYEPWTSTVVMVRTASQEPYFWIDISFVELNWNFIRRVELKCVNFPYFVWRSLFLNLKIVDFFFVFRSMTKLLPILWLFGIFQFYVLQWVFLFRINKIRNFARDFSEKLILPYSKK